MVLLCSLEGQQHQRFELDAGSCWEPVGGAEEGEGFADYDCFLTSVTHTLAHTYIFGFLALFWTAFSPQLLIHNCT